MTKPERPRLEQAAGPEAVHHLLALLGRVAVLSLLLGLLVACSMGDAAMSRHVLVIPIDRTGIAQDEDWSVEVATQTQAMLETAVAGGVDRVELIGIGSDTDQTATITEADFSDIEGNTEAKRDVARQQRIAELSSAAGQVAGQPVETYGSDLFAALEQAASLCRAPGVTRCSIVFLSDMEDGRVLAAPSADAAIEELTNLMPDLTGISIHVSGLGASGADAATVQRVKAAWTGLLDQAGAVDIRIARSR